MPQDPIADYMNTTGLQGLIGPNPYLDYPGKIPLAGYYGAPTDASGKPIASFTAAQKAYDAWTPPATPAAAAATPGTTLNSSPNGQYASAGAQMGDWSQLAPLSPGGPSTQAQWAYDLGLGGNVNPSSAAGKNLAAAQQPAAAAAAAPAAINPIDMRQAYLDALSNPGKVTTPGAVIQPGTTPTGSAQPSVLANFLAQHSGGGQTGGGGYSNKGFFDTLNALKPGATTT